MKSSLLYQLRKRILDILRNVKYYFKQDNIGRDELGRNIG
jgi:hypothetical protein